MVNNNPLILVITDELGSTPRDEKLRMKRNQKAITVLNYKKTLMKSRCDLFTKQIKHLVQPQSGWTVIKTLGDSLIISFKSVSLTDDLKNILSECLGSLFNAWKDFDGKLRVACHLIYLEDVVTGAEELASFRQSLQENAPNSVVLDPILQGFEQDIFGSPMNRAARLAHIPEDGLFVVSQEIMEKIQTPDYLKMHVLNNIPCETHLKSNSGSTTVWAYPVPVVNIKGVEPLLQEETKQELINSGYSESEIEELKTILIPWFVWEIEQKATESKVQEDKHKPLRVQFKGFQSLKVVAANFPGTLTDVVEKKACGVFENRLKENCCKLFVDLVFRVNCQYQLYKSDILRDFSTVFDSWDDILKRARVHQRLIPYYLMFTSVPDVKTNEKLRNFFTPRRKNWQFQHISYDVYENLQIKDEPVSFDVKTTYNYFLLLFQIRDDYVKYATDCRRFFEGINEEKPLYEKYTLESQRECICCAYGLIRGEFDGFVLFRSDADVKDIKGFIASCAKAKESFFAKIAPIFLFDLKLINSSEENIRCLKLLRKIQDAAKSQ